MTGAAASAQEVYQNDSFGYSATIPTGFQRSHTTSSGDGATFTDSSGAELDIFGYAMDLELNSDMSERMQFWIDGGGVITYQAAGENWYVLSGFTAANGVFYDRHVAAETCADLPIVAVMSLTYAQASRPRIDPLIGPTAASLSGPDCH
jgi:hypothetical protein